MRQRSFWLFTFSTVLAYITLVVSIHQVNADTIPNGSIQDLTNLGAISTTVTGLPDATFAKDEQKYQKQLLTSQTTWTGFCHQGGRDVTIQFQSQVDVQHIEIAMEQNATAGIYYPNDVEFEAYSNGQWYSLATQNTSISQNDKTKTTQVFQFTDSAGIETNEIRVFFPVNIFVFARGLDITGSTTESGDIPTSPTFQTVVGDTTATTGALSPSSPNAYGIANMLLVPTGSYGELGTWSESDFEPMLEYINSAGQVVAPLFDTMLFSPYANVPDTENGWTDYLNDLFQSGQELSALDAAVGATNESLNRPGYKEKVVLSIPYFAYGDSNFGTVNGQALTFTGTATDPDALNARNAVLNWYISTLLSRWKTADYQNLKLVGLYWDHEQFDSSHPGEAQIFQSAWDVASNNNLPLFWIPFYGAEESTMWKSLGISAAWLQPNYIEQGANANTTRISNAVNTATQNGMGIEVELTALDSNTESLYQTFLTSLDYDGFGSKNVSHAFYDGSKLLLAAEQSSDPLERQAYDETAAFILQNTQ